MSATVAPADRGQWLGILTGPLAWSGQQALNYGWEELFACTRAATTGTVAGIDVRALIVVLNLVLAAATAAAGLVASRRWQDLRGQDPTPGARAEWMALAGVLVSGLFFVAILFGIAVPLMLKACAVTP
jgi:hypothetical protein